MKKHLLLSVAAALLLLWIGPARANLIQGNFSGAVTATSGPLVSFSVGTPVSGTFSYNPDLAWTDSAGNRYTGYSDPATGFVVNIGGQQFASYTALFNGLNFSVDDFGSPLAGSAAGNWDLGINNGRLGLVYFLGGNNVQANVTYAVPDAVVAAPLLGIALAGVWLARRCFR